MKKAYLITAYDQPVLVARLVNSLQSDKSYFFLHVDRKVPLEPFRDAIGVQPNVKFLHSTKVTWMGYSQVQSTLDLMREAATERCDYYTLLSGSDYPIKSNRYIFDFFSSARSEYLSFFRLEDRPSWLNKIRFYYPMDLVPFWNYQEAAFRRYFWGYFFKLVRYMPHRSFLDGMVPYGGCGWWSLSHDCVRYILSYVAENRRLVRFYKLTHSPIEMFFQTIVLNSAWNSRVTNFHAYQEWSSSTSTEDKVKENRLLPEEGFNYRHIDWSPSRIAGLGRPATLDERDFNALRASKSLFARKFEESKSGQLLDMVDQMRREI